jgi:mono/diheme cytochrome c family protein
MKRIWLAAAGLCLFALASLPQEKRVKVGASGAVDQNDGPGMYQAYCASCHGIGGKGDGPAAGALKTRPNDLTLLKRANGGTFPAARVRAVIEGTKPPRSHGSRDMPVWGPVFRILAYEDASTPKLRIENLTRYIEGIQK